MSRDAGAQWREWIGNGTPPIVQVVAKSCPRLQLDKPLTAGMRAASPLGDRAGTGFLYQLGGKTFVVTARHVVMGCNGGFAIKPLRGQAVLIGPGSELTATLHGCNKAGDFALLQLPAYSWPNPLQPSEAASGGSLEMVGVPWSSNTSHQFRVEEGSEGRLDMLTGERLPRFQLLGSPEGATRVRLAKSGAPPGVSGGPLLSWPQLSPDGTHRHAPAPPAGGPKKAPVIVGMTVAHLDELTVYLPISFVKDEFAAGRVESKQCGASDALLRQLPLDAGSLPHVAEFPAAPCEIGVAQSQQQGLSDMELVTRFGGSAQLVSLRKKLGKQAHDQTFSRLRLHDLDLVFPEVEGYAGDLFGAGCTMTLLSPSLKRSQAYAIEVQLVPIGSNRGERELFDLEALVPTGALWFKAPASFTTDREKELVETPNYRAYSQTLAFVGHATSSTAKVWYLAKWAPSDKWRELCEDPNNHPNESDRQQCQRARSEFIAFVEAIQLLPAESSNAMATKSAAPVNQLPADALNELQ